jgi:uncharacterized protein YxjI
MISDKQPNATSQTPRETKARKLKSSRWEIIKIRAEINEKNGIKNQWNKKLVIWKNKQDWQTSGKPDWNEEGKDPN